jgi:hypothetical protein
MTRPDKNKEKPKDKAKSTNFLSLSQKIARKKRVEKQKCG